MFLSPLVKYFKNRLKWKIEHSKENFQSGQTVDLNSCLGERRKKNCPLSEAGMEVTHTRHTVTGSYMVGWRQCLEKE